MTFYIYIIINKINEKFYIGKTVDTIQQRFREHINDALTGKLDTKFARAIRKYGSDNFYIELLDYASTKKELSQKEKYWIKFLNAVQEGYNSTEGGEGGNTYISKTEEEMFEIKKKIRDSKIGKKNPNASAIKCKSVITGQEMLFSTVAECQRYFKEKNHNFITRRCNGKTKYVYAGEWIFAYKENDYFDDYSMEKKINKRKSVGIVEIESGAEHYFSSYVNAAKHFGFKNNFFSEDAYKHKNEPYWEKAVYRIFVLE